MSFSNKVSSGAGGASKSGVVSLLSRSRPVVKNRASGNTIQRNSDIPEMEYVYIVKHIDPDSEMFMHLAQNAYYSHLDNLVPCQKCGRKFFPDRIERHQLTCSAHPIKIKNLEAPNMALATVAKQIPSSKARPLVRSHWK